MCLQDVSKRVEKAVIEAHQVKRKSNNYNKLAVELENIAQKHGIPVDHVRRVSGIEYSSISKVIKYKEMGREDQFIKAFNKLEEYDKQRVRKALNL
jgi:tRNA uridine 5-carbamoylmethylation protein Kti12